MLCFTGGVYCVAVFYLWCVLCCCVLQVVCTVIAAFLQYFFLVEFFLMLAMGVYYFLQITVLYYSFSTANDIKARLNMKRLLPIAWGRWTD